MKKCIVIFLLMLVIASVNAEKIKIGFFQLEPYVIEQAGGKPPTGASVEYWETHIAPKIGVESEWVGPLPMLRLLKSLEDGEIDVIIVMAKNPDRDKRFLFPATYYLQMRPSLCFLKESAVTKLVKADDMFNMKIGYVDGAFIPPIMKHEKITIDMSKSENYKKNNFDKLLAKRIDAILDVNDISNLYEANRYGILDKIKMVLIPTDATPIFTIFPRTEKGEKLLKRYEPVNEKLHKTATFETIMKKYLPKTK